jgi:MFS family permease
MKYFYGVQGFVNQIGLTIATFLGIFGPPLLEKDFGIALSQGFGYVFLITAVFAFIPIVYVMRVALLYTVRSFLMLVPTPVLNAYVMNIVSEQIRASFLAISQLAWQIAFSATYFIAGFLWASDYTKVLPFYIAVGFYIVASLIFFAYFKNIKESHDEHAHSQIEPMKT